MSTRCPRCGHDGWTCIGSAVHEFRLLEDSPIAQAGEVIQNDVRKLKCKACGCVFLAFPSMGLVEDLGAIRHGSEW